MRLKKLIKVFNFNEDNRSLLTIGDDTRLNSIDGVIQLKADSDGNYPTTADLYVKTWTANPLNVKQWLLFEPVVSNFIDESGTQITFDKYRLGDGTDEYYWNGSSWEVNTTDWNTSAEICTNISTFSVSSLSIQVIINLSTTDEEYTPEVDSVKILYSCDIEFQEDLFYKSLLPDLKENIRPISDYPIKMTEDSDTIDLENDFPLKTPYNIVDIDSVFDHDSDENHLTDLFSSYDEGTKVITLSQSLTTGTKVWIKFIYEPEVAITTKRTYSEIGKVPCIVISDINSVGRKEGQGSKTVIDETTNEGVKVFPPIHNDFELVLRCLTDKARDQIRLTEEIKRYFRQNTILRQRGTDEECSIHVIDDLDMQNPFGSSEIEISFLRVLIENALFYLNGDEIVYGIQSFTVSGDLSFVVS
jgi:hypothetical protein